MRHAGSMLGLCLLACLHTPARGESMTQAVTSALKHFPDIRAAQANRRAAAELADQARGAYFPSADLLLGTGREETDSPGTRFAGQEAHLNRRESELTVTQLLFDNGVRSHIFVSWLHPFKEQKLVVIGSKKMASFDDVAKELVLYDQRVDWKEGQPIPVKGEGVKVQYPADEPLKAECLHFINAIETRQTPRTDGLNGLRVLQILHAAQRSLITNGQPVPFSAHMSLHSEPGAKTKHNPSVPAKA